MNPPPPPPSNSWIHMHTGACVWPPLSVLVKSYIKSRTRTDKPPLILGITVSQVAHQPNTESNRSFRPIIILNYRQVQLLVNSTAFAYQNVCFTFSTKHVCDICQGQVSPSLYMYQQCCCKSTNFHKFRKLRNHTKSVLINGKPQHGSTLNFIKNQKKIVIYKKIVVNDKL